MLNHAAQLRQLEQRHKRALSSTRNEFMGTIQQNRKLREELMVRDGQLLEKQTDVENLRRQVSQMQSRAKETSDQAIVTQRNYDALRGFVHSSQTTFRLAERRRRHFQARLHDVEKETCARDQKIHELQQQVTQAGEEIRKETQKSTALQQDLRAKVAEITSLKALASKLAKRGISQNAALQKLITMVRDFRYSCSDIESVRRAYVSLAQGANTIDRDLHRSHASRGKVVAEPIGKSSALPQRSLASRGGVLGMGLGICPELQRPSDGAAASDGAPVRDAAEGRRKSGKAARPHAAAIDVDHARSAKEGINDKLATPDSIDRDTQQKELESYHHSLHQGLRVRDHALQAIESSAKDRLSRVRKENTMLMEETNGLRRRIHGLREENAKLRSEIKEMKRLQADEKLRGTACRPNTGPSGTNAEAGAGAGAPDDKLTESSSSAGAKDTRASSLVSLQHCMTSQRFPLYDGRRPATSRTVSSTK
eukprot:scaffold731_cov261-Pinguiococcus_pyrenoidosus.AAC.11